MCRANIDLQCPSRPHLHFTSNSIVTNYSLQYNTFRPVASVCLEILQQQDVIWLERSNNLRPFLPYVEAL